MSDCESESEGECTPATSVHLNWTLPSQFKPDSCSQVEFGIEAQVEVAADCTYFCAIQFMPGGYCGIQQRNGPEDRLCIFSVWDDDTIDEQVSCLDHPTHVLVSSFGGEGTGLKSMKQLDWKEEDTLRFLVTSTKDVERGAWTMTCNIVHEGQNHAMAVFSRKGPCPATDFVSFVEDWNRVEGASGHEHKRSCIFSKPTLRIDAGPLLQLHNAKFSKVQSGLDSFAMDKCEAVVKGDNDICLLTGGTDCPNMQNGTMFKLGKCQNE